MSILFAFLLFAAAEPVEPVGPHEFGTANIEELSEPELRQELQFGYERVAELQQEVGDLYVTNHQQVVLIVVLAGISILMFAAKRNIVRQLDECDARSHEEWQKHEESGRRPPKFRRGR